MGRTEKTVFISYRRTDFAWAQAVYLDLAQHQFDVFLDYTGIGSGDFERVILENIWSRAHFLLLLTPSALDRCGEPDDWLRREIETAMASRRNIVPLMLDGFQFATPRIASQLTGKLERLKRYNGLTVPREYFPAAMDRLRDRFLNVPLEMVLHPASTAARQAAVEQKTAAATAMLDFHEIFSRIPPSDAFTFHQRGNLRHSQGDLEGALEDYNQAIRLNPHLAGAFYNRGRARIAMNDWKGVADYDEAIRLKPEFPEAFNKRGEFYCVRGNLPAALKDFGEAIRLKPDFAVAFHNREVARRIQGDLMGAEEDRREAVRLGYKARE